MSTNFCLYVPRFQSQVFKRVKILSERSEETKEQKENKGSVLVAESGYNAQNAQFGLVMFLIKLWEKKMCKYFNLLFNMYLI